MIYNSPDRFAPQMREAYARFRERYPQLAAMALLALLRHDDAADLPLLKEGTALIAGIEQPIDQLSNSLSNVTWMASSEDTAIKPERRRSRRSSRRNWRSSTPRCLPIHRHASNCSSRFFRPARTVMTGPAWCNFWRRNWPRRWSSSTLACGLSQLLLQPTIIHHRTAVPAARLPQMPTMIANRWGLDDSGGGFGLSVPAEETEKFKTAVRAAGAALFAFCWRCAQRRTVPRRDVEAGPRGSGTRCGRLHDHGRMARGPQRA